MRKRAIWIALLLTLYFFAAPALNQSTHATGALVSSQTQTEAQRAAREALIARAKSFELDTPYVPPPGDPLEHEASGYAKVMCSAVFITGLDADFAEKNIGGFIGPFEERSKFGKPEIDRTKKTVTVAVPNGHKRVAQYVGGQGCVTYPTGKDTLNFKPVTVHSKLPDAATQPWPNGDLIPKAPLPTQINADRLKEAVDLAFEPAEGMTAAFIVTWKGRLIAERYRPGISTSTPLESW